MKINWFQHGSWIDIYNMSEDENIGEARVYWTIFCLKMRILILYLDAMTVLKMTLYQNRFRDYIVSHSLLPSLILDNRISLHPWPKSYFINLWHLHDTSVFMIYNVGLDLHHHNCN